MIINQFDIVKTKESFEFNGVEYDYYLITFPCEDDSTETMWLVDALPCNAEGRGTPEGHDVGMPIHTDSFLHVVGNAVTD